MALSDSQLTVYKAHLLANLDPIIVQARSDGANNVITDWYNREAVPPYWIFKNYIDAADVRDVINANDIANITSADRDRAVALLNIRSGRGFAGSDDDDRAAWADVFSAAAGRKSKDAIAKLWTRLATNIEKVFTLATGNGATAATADTTSFQGAITLQDTRDAIALP